MGLPRSRAALSAFVPVGLVGSPLGRPTLGLRITAVKRGTRPGIVEFPFFIVLVLVLVVVLDPR